MSRPKVVIIGGGFGGVSAAKGLAGRDFDVTLIDRRNYHLFQPLLYQVATADLSPAEVAWPIRSIFRADRNVKTVLSEVTDVDTKTRIVRAGDAAYAYDYLVIASGSDNNYFGHDGWAPHAPGLKSVYDATEIRKRVLMAFERAELAEHDRDQSRLLSFVVIGGGPTGVELAGAIAELARVALARDFRRIDPKDARIVLLEAGERLLPGFDPSLSDYAAHCLERLGVEVCLGKPVTSIDRDGVRIGDDFVPSATVIWAAGVSAAGPGTWLDIETDRNGRIAVSPDLSAPGHPDVFVVGDAARVAWIDDKLVPGIAPAAKQQGRYVASLLVAKAGNHPPPKPFQYRHAGSLATIGKNSAVVDLGWLRLKGTLAWWFWGLIHIHFLINYRTATVVLLQWFWTYLTRRKGARLIVGYAAPDPAGPSSKSRGSKSTSPPRGSRKGRTTVKD